MGIQSQKSPFMFVFLTFMVGVLTISSASYAQQEYQDVVYLKNGSVVRGMIIEQVPNTSLKIQTADNSLFVFTFDEILKITKEKPNLGEKPAKKDGSTKPEGKLKRSTVALTGGWAIPFGDLSGGYYESETGIMLGIDFGYLLSNSAGISMKSTVSKHSTDEPDYNYSVSDWSVGPFYSHKFSNSLEWDVRALAGLVTRKLKIDGDDDEIDFAFSYGGGTSLRYRAFKQWFLALNTDFTSSAPEDATILSFRVGLGMRF